MEYIFWNARLPDFRVENRKAGSQMNFDPFQEIVRILLVKKTRKNRDDIANDNLGNTIKS